MLNVRSRVGVVAVTTGAAVLLALPVVAAGQVPGVDQVVGGVTETAESLVPAPVAAPAPAPPAPLPAPAPAPKPAPQAAPAPAAAPAAPAPAAPAPKATTVAGSTSSGSASGRGSERVGAKASSSAKRGDGAKDRREARADSGVKALAAQDDGASPTDVEIADQVVEAPADAGPSTLPFTGLQLLLVGMAGLAAIAGGGVLRRALR